MCNFWPQITGCIVGIRSHDGELDLDSVVIESGFGLMNPTLEMSTVCATGTGHTCSHDGINCTSPCLAMAMAFLAFRDVTTAMAAPSPFL